MSPASKSPATKCLLSQGNLITSFLMYFLPNHQQRKEIACEFGGLWTWFDRSTEFKEETQEAGGWAGSPWAGHSSMSHPFLQFFFVFVFLVQFFICLKLSDVITLEQVWSSSLVNHWCPMVQFCIYSTLCSVGARHWEEAVWWQHHRPGRNPAKACPVCRPLEGT